MIDELEKLAKDTLPDWELYGHHADGYMKVANPDTVLKFVELYRSVQAFRRESLKEGIWYTGMGCEFAEDIDSALAAIDGEGEG